jgi:hypothetical protein
MAQKVILYTCSISLLLFSYSCTEDQSTYSYTKGELIVDSLHVGVVRGLDPERGIPAGHIFVDAYFHLGGQTGVIERLAICPSPPMDLTRTYIYNSFLRGDPWKTEIPLELHEDTWFDNDYSETDSIWVYVSLKAVFWRQIDNPYLSGPRRFYMGDDSYFDWFRTRVTDERR